MVFEVLFMENLLYVNVNLNFNDIHFEEICNDFSLWITSIIEISLS